LLCSDKVQFSLPKIEGTFKPPSLRVTGTKTQRNPNPSQIKKLSDLYPQVCKKTLVSTVDSEEFNPK
jgi:hypothetical protein